MTYFEDWLFASDAEIGPDWANMQANIFPATGCGDSEQFNEMLFVHA